MRIASLFVSPGSSLVRVADAVAAPAIRPPTGMQGNANDGAEGDVDDAKEAGDV